jgi:murein L,D-transpeptidase YcbB/YkuD
LKTRTILVAVSTAVLMAVPPGRLAREPHPARFDRLAPIAELAPADAAVAEKLRDLLGFGPGHLLQSAPDRASVAAFYHLRGFAPLWIENGGANARALAAREYLSGVDSEGLDPDDYAPIEVAAGSDPATVAANELKFTATILQYARDARNGRMPFARVSADIDYPRALAKVRDILAAIAQSADVAKTLAAFNPPQPGYQALRAKLAALRSGSEHGGAAPPSAPHSVLSQADIIVANMERWRWLSHDLGNDYVLVNIADYSLALMHDGAPVFRTKVVVGAPDLPTPLLSATMTSITVNPIWNIPRSLVENEYLPALQRDPGLAARMGLKIERGSNGRIRISQPPSDRNVLGRIRFNFPNKFLVYQHDTNEHSLFDQPAPDSSHGCIRVENPFAYAVALLMVAAPQEGYSENRLRGLIGDHEVDIALPKPIPVHLTYQTAFVDARGDLVFRDDIYALDSRTLSALKAPRAAAPRNSAMTWSGSQAVAQSKVALP